MKLLFKFLKDIQDAIGCNCSISAGLGEIGDYLFIRIDWPEDLHLLYRYSNVELESILDDEVLKTELIRIALKEYKLKTVGEE